jgi:ketosteroid isomerase-like protein
VDGEQVVERFYAALSDLDAERAAELVDEDYEGYAVEEQPLRGKLPIYRGRAGIRAWIAETAEASQSYVIELGRVRRYGDDVFVVIGIYTAEVESPRSPFGEVTQRLPFVAVTRIRDGLIRSVHSYSRYGDAARAEGLPFDEPSGEERP